MKANRFQSALNNPTSYNRIKIELGEKYHEPEFDITVQISSITEKDIGYRIIHYSNNLSSEINGTRRLFQIKIKVGDYILKK